MIDQMMIHIHAIASSEEIEGHHMHAFRTLDQFFKLWLLEEGHNRKKEDIFDMTISLEDHYTRLYGPDLITDTSRRETEGDEKGEEEGCSGSESEDNSPLIPQEPVGIMSTSVNNLMNVFSPNSIAGAYKEFSFSNAVNASMISRQTEQSLSFNKTKNIGELSFYDQSTQYLQFPFY